MPVATGDLITKASIVSNYLEKIRNPPYNAIVFWDGNNLGTSRQQTSLFGPRDFSAQMSTSDIGDTLVTASTIVNQVRSYAYWTTAARYCRSGLITNSGTIDDRYDVCRLTDSYLINYNYSSASLSTDQDATALSLNTFMDNIRAIADDAQTSAALVDLRVCHSSCHSSCHGSRGRR